MPRPASPLVLLFLGLSALPFRSPAADRDARLADAMATFRAAAGGDAAKAARAHELLDGLSAESPDDPVVLAYAGAAEAMVGRDASSPIEALKQTERGLDRIDLALRKLGPEHDTARPGAMPARLESLLIAASAFLQVPDDVFHRRQDGKAALAAARSNPAYGHLPAAALARFEWLGAVVARGDQDAARERAALEKLLSLDPSGPFTPQARARLAELAP